MKKYNNKNRKKTYFGYIDHQNCILFQLLDKIHYFIYHINDIKKINNYSKDKFIVDASNDDDDNDKEDDFANTDFIFGEDFTYYDEFKDNAHFVIAKYLYLKDELINNPYYKLNINEYYDNYIKSYYLKQTEYFKHNCNVKNFEGNIICNISNTKEDDSLSINHLICLLTYCNNPKLTKIFKKNCKRKNLNETNNELNRRHCYIANWRRYLFETCFIFGDKLENKQYILNIINKKIILNSFNLKYNLPISTTTSKQTVQQFQTEKGIKNILYI